MTLFHSDETPAPTLRRRRSRGSAVGIWAVSVALIALLALTFLPSSFVIQQAGPVFNTLGTTKNQDGKKVPLISIKGAETFPTAGALDLLTVQVVGNRERTPSWFELASAWFDPSRAVVPIDVVFPQGESTDDRNQESAAMMVDSQEEATAAALTHLGYDVRPVVKVYSLVDGSPATGILKAGDTLRSADGVALTDTDALRAIINKGNGAPVSLVIERGGKENTVSVTPRQDVVDGKKTWLVGITTLHDYDFPIDVTIQLNNVGGPSAGMMFALGIIDTLTAGELNGGKQVAGTGTITSAGVVGPIGGIRQKLYGAKGAGAKYFLAPASNCDEVVGHVPSGLRVFAVSTLDDSLKVLTALRTDGDLGALPTCK